MRGRSDKKFCDDYCRNTFNNQLKSETNNHMRNINNSLRRNRRILQSLLPGPARSARAGREELARLGFNFNYFTHQDVNRKGKTCHYCYDYGYLPLDADRFQIIKYPVSGKSNPV